MLIHHRFSNYKGIEMNKIKEYFDKNNIPYKDIDKEIRYLVYAFNKIGLKTQFSCVGHSSNNHPHVIFDELVTYPEILNVANNMLMDSNYMGCFNKWVRSNNGEIVSNWCYSLNYNVNMSNSWNREKDLNEIADRIITTFKRDYENKKDELIRLDKAREQIAKNNYKKRLSEGYG